MVDLTAVLLRSCVQQADSNSTMAIFRSQANPRWPPMRCYRDCRIRGGCSLSSSASMSSKGISNTRSVDHFPLLPRRGSCREMQATFTLHLAGALNRAYLRGVLPWHVLPNHLRFLIRNCPSCPAQVERRRHADRHCKTFNVRSARSPTLSVLIMRGEPPRLDVVPLENLQLEGPSIFLSCEMSL